MRKIEAAMVMAVRDAINGSEQRWRSGNTSVEVEHEGIHGTPGYERSVVVRLHDNEIARFDSALAGDRGCRGLRITDAGWDTATTKSRLNALLQCFAEGSCLYQRKGQWYAPDGTEWWGTFWLPYGWREGWFCQQAEALSKPARKASESVYDVDWHRAMGETLAATKVAAAVTALA
jgi:hypothetical protein